MRQFLVLACVVLSTGCTASVDRIAESGVAETTDEKTAAPDSLAGTEWRLLNITSMNDEVDVPGDSSRYTVAFNADGTAALRIDCNRGTGSWRTEPGNRLTFGPIAATRAMCPPGSLADKYLAQFDWIRSYTLKDGHLFLATMADGSIIEFEPLPPVVATLFGEDIRASNAGELQGALLTRIFDQYAAERSITVNDAEVAEFIKNMRTGMAGAGLIAEDDLTPEEAAQAQAMQTEMAHALIRQWKINKSLYETYRGRIIYQQLGPEPLDAYREYLEELRDAGELVTRAPEMAEEFWRYFRDDSMHDFMEPASDEATNAFVKPPWE